MTEVLLTVALIAVATIGIIGLFGDQVRAVAGSASTALAGGSAGKRATRWASDDLTHRRLATFGDNESAAGDLSGGPGINRPNGIGPALGASGSTAPTGFGAPPP